MHRHRRAPALWAGGWYTGSKLTGILTIRGPFCLRSGEGEKTRSDANDSGSHSSMFITGLFEQEVRHAPCALTSNRYDVVATRFPSSKKRVQRNSNRGIKSWRQAMCPRGLPSMADSATARPARWSPAGPFVGASRVRSALCSGIPGRRNKTAIVRTRASATPLCAWEVSHRGWSSMDLGGDFAIVPASLLHCSVVRGDTIVPGDRFPDSAFEFEFVTYQ